MEHVVVQGAVAHAEAEARFFEEIGGHTHALHAAGNHHLGIARTDGLGGQHHRLEAGAADLVDGQGLDLPGQAGHHRGLLGRVLAVTAGQDLAHDALVDRFLVDPGPADGLGDDQTAQLGGAHVRQGAVEAAQGGSDRADYHCFSHVFSLVSVDEGAGPAASARLSRVEKKTPDKDLCRCPAGLLLPDPAPAAQQKKDSFCRSSRSGTAVAARIQCTDCTSAANRANVLKNGASGWVCRDRGRAGAAYALPALLGIGWKTLKKREKRRDQEGCRKVQDMLQFRLGQTLFSSGSCVCRCGR